MEKELICLVIAGTMLTACGGSNAVSSIASAAIEQASETDTEAVETEAESNETEAAPSTSVIYLKDTVTTYDKDGNLIRTTIYSYNDHNDVSEYVYTFPDDDPVRYYYEYDYRDDGTIASSRRYDDRDLLQEETFYEEDGETIDHIVKIYSDDEEDEEDSSKGREHWIKTQTILNADEVPLFETRFYEDGNAQRKLEREYNEYGDLIHVVDTRYENGKSSIIGEVTFEREYNSDGTIAKTFVVTKTSQYSDVAYYTDEYTYQDGYLYKEYSSGIIDDYSWWQEIIYDKNGFPVSWSSDDMEEEETEYYEEEDLAGLVAYRSDGTVDIQPEDGFIAIYDGEIMFVKLGSGKDINGDPDEELDENGNIAVQTYYSYTGDINKRVEYTYIAVEK